MHPTPMLRSAAAPSRAAPRPKERGGGAKRTCAPRAREQRVIGGDGLSAVGCPTPAVAWQLPSGPEGTLLFSLF